MTEMDADAVPAESAPVVVGRREGPVRVLTLNRPHRLNAVNADLYRALVIAAGD